MYMHVKFLDEVGAVNYVPYSVKRCQGNISVKSLTNVFGWEYFADSMDTCQIRQGFPTYISRHMKHHLF